MRKAVILFVVLMLLFKVGFSDEYYANESVVYKHYGYVKCWYSTHKSFFNLYTYIANDSEFKIKVFSDSLTSGKTLFKIYPYNQIKVINVSNTSQVLDTYFSENSSIEYLINPRDYLVNFGNTTPNVKEYSTLTYTNSQEFIIGTNYSFDGEEICSEGKCNVINVSFGYFDTYEIANITYIHFGVPNKGSTLEFGSTGYSGVSEYIHNYTNEENISLIAVYSISTTDGLTFDLENPTSPFDILSPYNLNTLVYVKNDNHYEYAIYVKYNGTIYLLTANNGNYDGFYTDSGLVHYVQCGNTTSNEIDLGATKHPILVQASGGNNFIDVDSICSADSGVNLPDIETINETISNYMSKDYCGMYSIAYDENYLNISGILNDSYYTNGSYATIMLNIIYWNGTTSTISTWGDYNYTFNKSKLFSLKMYCVYNTTPFHIWKYNISYFQGEHKYDLLYEYTNKTIIKDNNSYFWVIYFLGVIPAIFLVGRNHLKIIVGFAFIILFLHIWGIMSGNLIMLLVVLVLTIAMVNRWII